MQAALNRLYPTTEDEASAETDDTQSIGERQDNDIAHLRDMASEAPVIRRVNQLIARALELRASDIHIEPLEHGIAVRYRIDGVLRTIDFPGAVSPAAVVSRIKVMASLNIAERRLPQDGRMRVRVSGREIDLRVSFLPTVHGEKCVLRILDKSNLSASIDKLGMDQDTFRRFKAAFNQLIVTFIGCLS